MPFIADVEEDGNVYKVFTGTNFIEYKLNGKIHREGDRPAVITTDSKGWYRNGRLHREEGPAKIYKDHSMIYYRNGKKHRSDNRPAVIYYGGDFEQDSDYPDILCLQYWVHGNLHRTDGPADIRIGKEPRYTFCIDGYMVSGVYYCLNYGYTEYLKVENGKEEDFFELSVKDEFIDYGLGEAMDILREYLVD